MKKVCLKCNKSLLLSAFGVRKTASDGLRGTCKLCRSKEDKEWRANNKEKYNTYINAHYAKNKVHNRELRRKAYIKSKGKRLEKIKAWNAANPVKCEKTRLKYIEDNLPKVQVMHQTNRAIRDGKLIKINKCVVCKKSPADKHHCDYNKPLDVMWLCRKHHKAWHKIFLAEMIK